MGERDLFDFDGSGSLSFTERVLKSDEELREMKQILSGGSVGQGGGCGKNSPGLSSTCAQGSGKKPLIIYYCSPALAVILWALTAFGFIAFIVLLCIGGD